MRRIAKSIIRFRSAIVLSLLICLFAGNQAKAQRGATGELENPAQQKGNVWALLVGISKYEKESMSLKYAHADAMLMEQYLLKNDQFNIPEHRILKLTNEKADEISIFNSLDLLYDSLKTGDKVILFFAGHGDVVKHTVRENGYFLAYNANDQREYRGGGVLPFSDLNAYVDVYNEKGVSVWLITDACRSGKVINADGSNLALTALHNGFNNTVKFISCLPNQLSYEKDSLQHGVFTYYLVQGLMGLADNSPLDNKLTPRELEDFVYEEINSYLGADKQTPTILAQNPRSTLAFVSSELKDQLLGQGTHLLAMDNSAGRRGIGDVGIEESNNLPEEIDIDYINAYNQALKSGKLYGSDGAAMEIYLDYSDVDNVNQEYQRRMRDNLFKKLVNNSQLLINKHLQGLNNEPQSDEFSKAAKDLEQALTLIDEEHRLYGRLHARKLFLDAYSIIRSGDHTRYKTAREKLNIAIKLEPDAAFTHNAMGLLYDYDHKFDSAIYHLEKAIGLIPTWTYPRSNLGNVYKEQANYGKAIEVFDSIIAMDPNLSRAYNNVGNVYLDLHRLTEAEQYYRKAIELNPTSPTPTQNLGVLYQRRGRYEDAKRQYLAALEMDSSYVWPYYNLADLYIDYLEDYAEGLSYLEKAREIEPYFAQSYTDLADYYRSKEYTKETDEIAEKHYLRAIELNPYYSWAYAGLGWLYTNMGKDEAAEDSFLKGIETIPDRAQPYYYAGDFYHANGNIEKAKEYLEKAIQLDSLYQWAYLLLGEIYEENKNPSEAEKYYTSIYDRFSNSPSLIKEVGDYYLRSKDTTNAIHYYNKAAEVDSTYAFAYSSMSYLYLETNQFEMATKAFLTSVRLSPYIQKEKVYIRNLISKISRLKDQDKRITGYKTVLEVDPENYTALYNLALLNYLNNNTSEALLYIDKIQSLSDSNSMRQIKVMDLKGRILIARKEYEEAIEMYEFILQNSIHPSYLGMAIANYQNGNKDRGIEYFESEVKSNPHLLKEENLGEEYNPEAIRLIGKIKKKYEKSIR